MPDLRRCVAEIPSFTVDDVIDTGAVRNAAQRLAGVGFAHIAVGGFFGEYNQLTKVEQTELIRAAMDGAGADQVCAGVMDASTEKAAERVAEHAALGCHKHLCIPSYYFSNNEPGELTRHFDALRSADPEGRFLIGDSRAHVGYHMSARILKQLAAPIFVYDPDAAFTSLIPCDIPLLVREELVLTGTPDHAFISCLAVVFPKLVCQIDQLPQTVRKALLTILTVHSQPVAGVKYAAWRMGLCASPELLPPAHGLSNVQKQLLDAAIELAQREEERCYG